MRRHALALALFALPGAADAEPNVVATIPPVHSLVAAVMDGVGTPELIVPADVSEHDYALKPSDLRKIAAADLLVWVGPQLETFLVHPLETEGTADLRLIDAPGVEPVPFSEAEADGHDEEEDEAGHESHEENGLDPHVWLDPIRAEAMVMAIVAELASLDAENADAYTANGEALVARLDALHAELEVLFAPEAGRPFITFHEGYNYLVARYGLDQVGHFTVDPQRRPGAATVAKLRDLVVARDVACIFAEPQYDSAVIDGLVGRDVEVGALDALGAGLEEGPDLYFELMARNAAAIKDCLAVSG